MNNVLISFSGALAASALVACGGGDGGSGATPDMSVLSTGSGVGSGPGATVVQTFDPPTPLPPAEQVTVTVPKATTTPVP